MASSFIEFSKLLVHITTSLHFLNECYDKKIKGLYRVEEVNMSAGHNHAIPTTQNEKYLWIALGLTSLFLVIEVIGSWFTGSLALLSDAAHMMTDASALAISLAAMRIGRKPADIKRTFGYYRLEILAAAFNCILP